MKSAETNVHIHAQLVYLVHSTSAAFSSLLQVIVVTFLYLVMWLCLTGVFSMILTVYIQLTLGCNKYDDRRNLGNTCTTLYKASECMHC